MYEEEEYYLDEEHIVYEPIDDQDLVIEALTDENEGTGSENEVIHTKNLCLLFDFIDKKFEFDR